MSLYERKYVIKVIKLVVSLKHFIIRRVTGVTYISRVNTVTRYSGFIFNLMRIEHALGALFLLWNHLINVHNINVDFLFYCLFKTFSKKGFQVTVNTKYKVLNQHSSLFKVIIIMSMKKQQKKQQQKQFKLVVKSAWIIHITTETTNSKDTVSQWTGRRLH